MPLLTPFLSGIFLILVFPVYILTSAIKVLKEYERGVSPASAASSS